MSQKVTVVGAGLAGSECALQLASRGISVELIEQRPVVSSPAHHTDMFAELVCSNSLKSTKEDSAAGILKSELKKMGSFLLSLAEENSVPAGGALAVNREEFSRAVTEQIRNHPNISVTHAEVTELSEEPTIIAAGPLCSDRLYKAISERVGTNRMSFFDAAAPIVSEESIDRSIAFSQSRYDDLGIGDYLNCPMNKEEYDTFVDELLSAKRVIGHDFEQSDLFQACQPIEEVARTGHDSIRFGALKPVGLIDPRTGKRPWAAVQLRAENTAKTAFNLVGFQTNLTWGEQKRVFTLIPGLENAEFVRYGVMHRNSFVDSPHALDGSFGIPGTSTILAGQITGTEGYVEAIASGLLAALNMYARLSGKETVRLPLTTSFGSLVGYATNPKTKDYQPMHVNFGIFEPLAEHIKRKDERRQKMMERAHKDFDDYIASRQELFDCVKRD